MSRALLSVLSLFVIGLLIYKTKEGFRAQPQHPSKCFSCEQEQSSWVGQKSKCFSCESSAIVPSPPTPLETRYYGGMPVLGRI
jgi:hypothetical protein